MLPRVNGVDLREYEVIIWMLGVSIGWIFMSCVYFALLMFDEDESDIIELEEGESLSVPSDWEQ